MDWVQRWKQSHRNMPYHVDIIRDYENLFWAALAPYYDELHCAEFSQAASRKLDSCLQGLSSILEIGAGTGALTLDLARKVGRLTALDASPDMLRILKEKLQKRAVNNVHPLLSSWEDAEVECHDLVLASGCTYGFHEIDRAVEKMVLSAAKAIAFTGETNRREPAGLSSLRKLFQRDLQCGRDEPVLYNVLCQMGLYPDVHML